jgi:hypothetical protein
MIRPRLTDYHGVAAAQEELDFAIPFLAEDIPLYLDPFLLWKSPSMQDQALHGAVIAAINHLGHLSRKGGKEEALTTLIALSECSEVGLGHAANKRGHRISRATAEAILTLFTEVPQIATGGLGHIEELQLLVDQISRDRISDFSCNFLKSFLVDYTIDQCRRLGIPLVHVVLKDLYDLRDQRLKSETLELPVNPENGEPILLVPKRWLRYVPWINYDDYFAKSYAPDHESAETHERGNVLHFNRLNYGIVQQYVAQRERAQEDCHKDPLFKQIPVLSAKRKLAEIRKLKTGNDDKADKKYEDAAVQLLASLMYPQLDFAADQTRTDSGALIRDLIFYNTESTPFLTDIRQTYDSRQLLMELKNVKSVEREHVNQLNRYLNDSLGRFGVLVTRNPVTRAITRNLVDLWSGQRRAIIVLTDADLETMVTVFESRQRLPLEVVNRAYVDFIRSCPS